MKRAPSVCLEPACPKLVEHGNRCAEHAVKPAGNPHRSRPYSGRWRGLSVAYRRAHPVCERCRLAPSEHVHHRDGLGPDGPHGMDWAGLKALCHRCHSRQTVAEDGGFGRPRRAA